jgi:drug/metabolite transporter (DMT)-like permease
MTLVEWGMLVLLSLIWGGSFYFNGLALRHLPPLTLVWVRVFLAALTLWIVIALWRITLPRDKRVWGAFILMGLFNNIVPFGLIAWGQTHIASALASILNATTPLFGVIVAHFFTTDERMTPAKLVGVVLGFMGVVIMLGGSFINLGSTTSYPSLFGQIAVMGAALSYASATVYGRRFHQWHVSPLAVATGQVTISSIMLLPLVIMIDQPWLLPTPDMATVGAMVCLGVVSTAGAYLLFFRILATAGATNITLVTFLIPVSAIFLGVSLLNEQLLNKHIIGFGLIALGLVYMDGRVFASIHRFQNKG